MIIDASAVLAVVFFEPEAIRFKQHMHDNRKHLCMSPINCWEVMVTHRMRQTPQTRQALELFMASTPLKFVDIDQQTTNIAIEAQFRYGRDNHPAKLNMGDCFAYALAKSRNDTLLFKGDDFIHTDIRPAL